MIFILFGLALLVNASSLNKRNIGAMWFLFLTFLVFGFFRDLFEFLYHGNDSLDFVLIPVSLLFGYVFYITTEKPETIRIKYVQILGFLSLISLIASTLLLLSPGLISNFPSYVYGGFSSKTIFLVNFLTTESGFLSRNTGFSSEPGLFQFYVAIALVFELQSQARWWIIGLFVVTIMSTESTLGVILLIVMLVLRMNRLRSSIPMILLALVMGCALFQQILWHSSNKLLGSVTFVDRFAPLVNIIDNFRSNFWGLGSRSYGILVHRGMRIGSWDSYSQMFIRYGYPLLMMYLLVIREVLLRNLMIGLAVVLTLASQSLWFNPFVVYLILDNRSNE